MTRTGPDFPTDIWSPDIGRPLPGFAPPPECSCCYDRTHDALLAVLQSVEWGGTESDSMGIFTERCCPLCRGIFGEGHAVDCALDAALRGGGAATRFAVGQRVRFHGRDVGCPECVLIAASWAGETGVIREVKDWGPKQPHIYRVVPDGWGDSYGINGIWTRPDEIEAEAAPPTTKQEEHANG